MIYSPLDFFTDPVFRAPTIGSMLMCLASSLIGVLVIIRKRSLLGEALSHASYPGVVIGLIFLSSYFPFQEEIIGIGILVGAFCTSLLALFIIHKMERKLRVKSDAALCFVLSVFFGVGILIASRIQTTHAMWYKQIQLFLYGQSATLMDIHVLTYGILCCLIITTFFLLYRSIEAIHFDVDFSKSIGIRVNFFENMIYCLLVLAICIGIRSVGVVLMSGMLIAPGICARQFTHRLSILLILSGFFGLLSGFFGNYFSVIIPELMQVAGEKNFSLPTGPMILLFATALCAISFIIGLSGRYTRIIEHKWQCRLENALKSMWKNEPFDLSWSLSFWLKWQGWVDEKYHLTPEGFIYASRIVRLHRLWEVYLVDYLGQKVEKVHRNAEEMEHIITPELEKELMLLLKNPKLDPHKQPIPRERL